jgi:hypothetical protein
MTEDIPEEYLEAANGNPEPNTSVYVVKMNHLDLTRKKFFADVHYWVYQSPLVLVTPLCH